MKKTLLIVMAVIMLFTVVSCGKSKSDNSDVITIAFIGNTTGDYAQYGVPVRNAAKLFFDKVNEEGGINGKQVVLLEYDDKADATESVNALNLAVDKGATAIIGSVLTGATVALSDATYEINMPEITASATSPKVTVMDPDNPASEVKTNVFRTCFLDPYQGEKMATYINNVLKKKTVAVFYENGSDYSEAIVAGFEKEASKNNLKVLIKESFSTGDVDYKAQMTNIAAANPDVVIMPIYYGEAGNAIRTLRSLGCKAQVIGGDGFGSVKNYASAEELEGSVYFSGYAPGTESVAEFEKLYCETYKVDEVPNMFAPLAWDAALVLREGLEAAEKSGKKCGSAEYKQVIIDTIKGMQAFKGITGSYTFNATNDPVKSIAVIKLHNGEEVFDSFF